MKESSFCIIVGLVLLAFTVRIFSDPFHKELRGFTFAEWVQRELYEIKHGEQG